MLLANLFRRSLTWTKIGRSSRKLMIWGVKRVFDETGTAGPPCCRTTMLYRGASENLKSASLPTSWRIPRELVISEPGCSRGSSKYHWASNAATAIRLDSRLTPPIERGFPRERLLTTKPRKRNHPRSISIGDTLSKFETGLRGQVMVGSDWSGFGFGAAAIDMAGIGCAVVTTLSQGLAAPSDSTALNELSAKSEIPFFAINPFPMGADTHLVQLWCTIHVVLCVGHRTK